MSGSRRPNRSARSPKTTAPIGRKASVAVIVQMISFFGTPKCSARVSTMKTTTKKSNASMVHPRNPAATACQRSREGAPPATRGLS